MSDKGVRTQPAALKEQLRDSFGRTVIFNSAEPDEFHPQGYIKQLPEATSPLQQSSSAAWGRKG